MARRKRNLIAIGENLEIDHNVWIRLTLTKKPGTIRFVEYGSINGKLVIYNIMEADAADIESLVDRYSGVLIRVDTA